MEIHRIHPELLNARYACWVVGCGGTGSAVIAGFALPSSIAYGAWPSRGTACYGYGR